MNNAIRKISQFLRDEDGVEVVEWGVIIGLIAVASLGVITGLSLWVSNIFHTLSTGLGS
jgi:pilus assembly protein Flp/PilA